MTRRLFDLAAALSLLLSLTGSAAWVMSYARPAGWRLIGMAHSADLTPVDGGPGTAIFATAPDGSKGDHHGFWDALWALSHTGRLTLLTQAVDYEGTLRQIHASPPSLTLDLPHRTRPRAILFPSVPDSGPWQRRLGFASDSDAQVIDYGDGGAGPVSARARIVTLPYWFVVLLGLPAPFLRLTRRRRATPVR